MNTVIELWKKYHRTRADNDRNEIVCYYMPLAQSCARRIRASLTKHADYDELESAAYVGLISAVERYDPSRKIKFETFSYPRIRGAIIDWLRIQDKQSRSIRKFEKKMEQLRDYLNNGDSLNEEEMAHAMGLSHADYNSCNEVLQRGKEIYISFLESSKDSINRVLEIIDPYVEDPSSTISTKFFIDFIFAGLSHQERAVAIYYHFGGLNLKQIGEKLGFTESRVSQLKAQAYNHIRSRLQEQDNLL